MGILKRINVPVCQGFLYYNRIWRRHGKCLCTYQTKVGKEQ